MAAGPVLTDRAFRASRARPLDGLVRDELGVSWNAARELVRRGKVTVHGVVVLDAHAPVAAGAELVVRANAPRRDESRLDADRVVFVDPHLVVVNKPAGISTVPYDAGERGTLEELTRQELVRRHGHPRNASLGVVHRIDKETSGLVVFARTFLAKKKLGAAFREHTIERRYLAIVHGKLTRPQTYDTIFVEDRGDGLRGTTRRGVPGQHAITHVEPLAQGERDGQPITLVACRLETGRTHQIRIHLAEAGHPLLGERVYSRDRQRRGEPMIAAPRMMLHAAVLGFSHPVTGANLRFEQAPPADFEEVKTSLSLAPSEAPAPPPLTPRPA